jgi:hypothetical protein
MQKVIKAILAALNSIASLLTRIAGQEENWEARSFVNYQANRPITVSGPGQLGGVLLLAGALQTTVRIYDQDTSNQDAGSTIIVDDARLKWMERSAAGILNKWTGVKLRIRRSIIINIDQGDAIVVILYKVDAFKYQE